MNRIKLTLLSLAGVLSLSQFVFAEPLAILNLPGSRRTGC